MNELQTLFNFKRNDDGSVAVSGRELHKGLEIETPYKQWMNRMIDYGFEENTDYILVTQKSLTNKQVEQMFLERIRENKVVERFGKQFVVGT